ncbi:MAG: hypothetical protein JNL98_37625, partial [Bryobacterales bacterium]|nr:hypothetical protein [Bryobacterales bacterium]
MYRGILLKAVLLWSVSGVLASADHRALRDRIQSINDSLRETALSKSARSASHLRPLIEERYHALRKLVALDPALAKTLLLEQAVADEWRTAHRAVASLLETPEAYEGQAEVIVADPEDPTAQPVWIYRFHSDLKPVDAYAANEIQADCDSILRIEGLRLGDRMIVMRAEITGRAQEAPRCTPLGTQRVAVLMVRFPGVAEPPISKQQVADAFFGETGRTVRTYYTEGSFGQVTMQGDVFGWYELDRAYICDESTQLRAAAIRAADNDIDFREYDRIYILFTRPASGCPWAGLGTVGCNNSTSPGDGAIRVSTSWQPVTNNTNGILTVATHELGHNLGLGHARTLRFPGLTAGPDRLQSISAEYGDRFSTMGNQAVSHHTMAHKVRMGWHDARTAVTEVTADGEFEIMPMQAEGDRPRALRVRRHVGPGQWLWVEYRQPIGAFDSVWPANVRTAYNGALVRLEDTATGIASDLIDFNPPPIANFAAAPGNFVDPTLKPGRIWQDPFSNLTLEVLEATPERLRVAVRYEPQCVNVAETMPALLRGTLSIPGDLDRVFVKLDAPDDCRYPIQSNTYWLQNSQTSAQGAASMEMPLAPNLETAARSGSITIGRNTILARQDGRPEPPSLTFLTPLRGEVPKATASTWQLGFRDPNGTADIARVHLLIHTGLEFARSCYLRIDYANNRFGVADDAGAFGEVAIAANRVVRNAQCEVTYNSRVALSPFESRLQVAIRFLSPSADSYRVFTQITDSTGRTTDWQENGAVTFSDACAFLPTPGRIVSTANGATVNLVLQTAPNCEWSAAASEDWIAVGTATGTGQRMIPITVRANPEAEDRKGTLRIGGTEVQVEQFGTQNTDVAFLSFSPRETTIGAAGGEVRVTVSASPST